MHFDPRRGRLLLAVPAILLSLVAALPARTAAQVEGVSYTLTPSAEVLRWNSDVGLSDTELYGGRLGINFGQFLTLQGYYLGRDGVGTDLAGTGLLDGANNPLVDQDVDVRSMGGDLVLQLGRGRTVPFLKAGAGVMEFQTADGDESNQIGFRLGGGVRFGLDRYRFMAYVEDAAYRSDRYALAAGPTGTPFPEDPKGNEIQHSLAFGAGLELQLGGQRSAMLSPTDRALVERYRSGLKGISWPLEPYYARLDFSDEVDLPIQDFLGVRTGLDFGSYVGLRGYFAQGVNDAFDDTAPIQSYGGEMFFNLNAGQGAIPYLIAGVGMLDFESAFRDGAGEKRDDELLLTLGGGLSFTVSDRVRVDLALRDHILSQAELDETSSTDQLTHNWGWSAGIRMALGGGRSLFSPAQPTPAPVAVAAPDTFVAEVAAPVSEVAEPVAVVEPTAPTPQVVPEVSVATEAPKTVAGSTPSEAVVESFQGERRISIPLPTQGELYLRYGRPGGVNVQSNYEGREDLSAAPAPQPAPRATESVTQESAPELDLDALRSLLREELDREAAARQEAEARRQQQEQLSALERTPAAGTTPPVDSTGGLTTEQQLELLERRLADRMDERIEARAREIAGGTAPATQVVPPSTIVVEGGGVQAVDGESAYRWRPKGIDSFLGASVDEPEQFVLGGRVDLGPMTRGGNVHFIPELSFGFGSGATSFMVAGNFVHQFGAIGSQGTWAPFVGAGLGILGFNDDVGNRAKREGVLNLSYGVTANLGNAVAFVEHQGVDLFDVNRLLVGLRWPLGR